MMDIWIIDEKKNRKACFDRIEKFTTSGKVLKCTEPDGSLFQTTLEDGEYIIVVPDQLSVADWPEVLNGIDVYQQYLELLKADKPVSALRDQSILMKPAAQIALAHVAVIAKRKKVPWGQVVEKLNHVDWSLDNRLWFNVLVSENAQRKRIVGKGAIRSAGMVISYLVLGELMSESEIAEVQNILQQAHNDPNETLPTMIP